MFNKSSSDSRPANEPQKPQATASTSSKPAVIGASISIDGIVHGAEDLHILGSVKGTIQLPEHGVTVGHGGQVSADVVAAQITIDGQVEGNLIASGCVTLNKTARVTGRIVAPRVRQEEGGYFKGTIDMDTDSEALKKAFASSKRKAVSEHPSLLPAEEPAESKLIKSAS